MDALLSAFMACLLGEMGGRGQLLAMILALRYRQNGAVLSGIAIAGFANAALAALGGYYISCLISADARSLFCALALMLSGAGLLLRVKAPDSLAGWRIGAFATSLLGLFILGFGDGSQFLIAGIATRTADPAMAALGGALGVFCACVPVVLLHQRFFTTLPIRWIRRLSGIAMLFIGAILGLSATGLL